MAEFFMVVAAVSAPFLIGSFVSHYFEYRSLVVKRMGSTADERIELENAQLRDELKALRERVQVLEAIVTDKKYDLSLKIANL